MARKPNEATATDVWLADEWPCEECGEYTTGTCRKCRKPVCYDCNDIVHDCDEDWPPVTVNPGGQAADDLLRRTR
jgi:predicted RNA-binding Zn-ribbon protein involved in translation (DUF1610 family)